MRRWASIPPWADDTCGDLRLVDKILNNLWNMEQVVEEKVR